METGGSRGRCGKLFRLIESPTIFFSLLLIIVYVLISAIVGDFLNPLDTGLARDPLLVIALAQCNPCILFQPIDLVVFPWTPWTLGTSMFLHVGLLHLGSNIFFLLIFGWILEEQLNNWMKWAMIFLLTGIAGNLTFLAAYAAVGPFVGEIGVGASGAVYGVLGAASGLKIAILLILIAGLDIFSGGGFFAHIGGLITGILIRKYWITPQEL